MKYNFKSLRILLLLVFTTTVINLNSQELAVKTNIPYWLTSTPNIGVEYSIARNLSFELTAGFNPFKFGEDARVQHWVVWPELRYWTYEYFNGHFIGIHGVGGKYNIGGWDLGINKLERLKNRRVDGHAIGGGISYGYQWILKNRWSFELTAGVGFARFKYDTYTVGSDEFQIGFGKKNYFGPTKGAFSLIYLIN